MVVFFIFEWFFLSWWAELLKFLIFVREFFGFLVILVGFIVRVIWEGEDFFVILVKIWVGGDVIWKRLIFFGGLVNCVGEYSIKLKVFFCFVDIGLFGVRMGVDDLVLSMENFGMLDRSFKESREVFGEMVSDVVGVLEFEIGMRDF